MCSVFTETKLLLRKNMNRVNTTTTVRMKTAMTSIIFSILFYGFYILNVMILLYLRACKCYKNVHNIRIWRKYSFVLNVVRIVLDLWNSINNRVKRTPKYFPRKVLKVVCTFYQSSIVRYGYQIKFTAHTILLLLSCIKCKASRATHFTA